MTARRVKAAAAASRRRAAWDAAKVAASSSGDVFDRGDDGVEPVVPMARLSGIPGHEMTPIGKLPAFSHSWIPRKAGSRGCSGDPGYRAKDASLSYIYIRRGLTWYKQRINCGRCAHCQSVRTNQFASQIVMELDDVSWSCWLTLTFANSKQRNIDQWHKVLKQRPFGLFIDLFRKHALRGVQSFEGRSADNIRYAMVGEYGKTYGRAHFHVLLWGDGQRPVWLPDGGKPFQFHIPEWPHGHVKCDPTASHYAAKYQAKYQVKQQAAEKAVAGCSVDPEWCTLEQQALWDAVYRLRYRYYDLRRRRPLRHWTDEQKAMWKGMMDAIFPPVAIWSRSNRSALGSRWAKQFGVYCAAMGVGPPIDWRVKVGAFSKHEGLLRGAARRDFILSYAAAANIPVSQVAARRSGRMQGPIRAADVWLRRRVEAKMPLPEWLAGFADEIKRKAEVYRTEKTAKPSAEVISRREKRGDYVPRAHKPVPPMEPDPFWGIFTRLSGPRVSYRF